MAKTILNNASDATKPARQPILGGPVQRPYPGKTTIPVKTIRKAVEDLFRARAAGHGTTTKA